MSSNREGLTVVIAGASSGFGKETAKQLAEEGANVVIGARRTRLIEELADQLGASVIPVTMDISKEADVKKLYDTALDNFGKIDVWINMAGIGLIGNYTEIPVEDMKRMLDINVLGTMIGSQYALKHFRQQKKGTIINLGSVAAQVPFPYYTAYSASKYAVSSLSYALQREMEVDGYEDIHVCTVHPWATDTPWFDHSANYSGHRAQMKPMDKPESVVKAIIGLIDEPEESVEVGIKTKGTGISESLLPGLTEKFNANYVKSVIEDAPEAPYTSGSLHEPMESGTETSAGMKTRMKADKKYNND
ncbi:SDR family NAD(P)-dependent oxidoreductase [Salinicoccus sp. ID82-1]|uniref:SDR family NAD(P)-dependent oxidoreductase n=1 Tax=Salinicoccus cyprini TaxID=2493691 RepID=A0A558ARR5_9STAP|nr:MULTISPECIES: SDR family NAD(P)-dependent oxidoreductase [Salinicoccus]MCG1009514.1 SDR family NAD(P)-dependent oxidoreductase [Salinicoccus sp. ID82-1]TVT26949.1 SDR family NAD(P)-dependent oxidoreductase [Salinicoccus cyprini]